MLQDCLDNRMHVERIEERKSYHYSSNDCEDLAWNLAWVEDMGRNSNHIKLGSHCMIASDLHFGNLGTGVNTTNT